MEATNLQPSEAALHPIVDHNGGAVRTDPLEDKALLQWSASDVENSGNLFKKGEVSVHGEDRSGKLSSMNSTSGLVEKGIRYCLDNYMALSLTASMATSISGLCLRVITQEISVFQVVLIYASLGFTFLSTFCTVNGIPVFKQEKRRHLFVLRGFVGSLGFIARSFGQFLLPVSEFAFVSNSYPAVTAVLSWALGMEQMSSWTWIGIVGSLVGNGLIAHPPFLFGGHEDWGLHRILGLTSATVSNVLVALTFLIVRWLGKSAHPMALTCYMHFFTILSCIPFLFIGYPMPMNARHSPLNILCYMGSWLGLFVQLCISRSLQLNTATKVTSIYMTNMLFSCLLGLFVLSEKISWVSGIGAIVTVVSVLMVLAPKPKATDKYFQLPTVDNADELEMTNQVKTDF